MQLTTEQSRRILGDFSGQVTVATLHRDETPVSTPSASVQVHRHNGGKLEAWQINPAQSLKPAKTQLGVKQKPAMQPPKPAPRRRLSQSFVF